MKVFGLEESSKALTHNFEKDDKCEECDEEEMGPEEAKEFRGVTARVNFLGQDSLDLQYPVKECSRDMARPSRGAWKRAKKVSRYLVYRKAVVWKYGSQEETGEAFRASDSDWGSNSKDRRSTSNGVWILRNHAIKTSSCTQGAYALSSAARNSTRWWRLWLGPRL